MAYGSCYGSSTDDDYEVWTHRDAAHAYGFTGSVAVHTPRSDAIWYIYGYSFRPCFWSYSKRQGARTTARGVWVQEAWYSYSIYPTVPTQPRCAEAVGARP